VFGRGVEVVDHRVHRVEGSDHRAVEVELKKR
jgi:endonuclease/exonuclease/phosphatase (EEP) superfamily protein YafD